MEKPQPPEPGPTTVFNDRLVDIYDELRKIARARMKAERANHTLQATALVNEAWMKLGKESSVRSMDRTQLISAAARAIREILIDHARARNAGKRGSGKAAVASSDLDQLASIQDKTNLIELDEALKQLAELDEEAAKIVELHFFGGLTMQEIADTAGISLRKASYRWKFARAWLKTKLG